MRVAMIVVVVAVMGGVSAAAERPPSQPPGVGGLAIGQTFDMAVAGTPTEYLFCRGEILEAGARARPVLERERDQKGGPWLRAALAAAMLQRMDEPEEVRLLEEEFQHGKGVYSWWGRADTEPSVPSGYREDWRTNRIVQQGERSVPFLVEKLFKHPPREVTDMTVVGHRSADPRGRAAWLLRLIGGKAAARAMAVFLLTMPDPSSRGSRAPAALSEFDRASAPDRVLKAAELTDQQLMYQMLSLLDVEKMRPGAAWVLGELRDLRAVAPLAALLRPTYHYPPPGVSMPGDGPWISEALGKMGEAAVPILADLYGAYLSGAQRTVTDTDVILALRAVGGPKAVPPLLRALTGPGQDQVGEAAQALGEIGDPAAIPRLMSVLRYPSPFARASSAWALGQLCAEVPEALAEKAKSDPSEDVRKAAAEAVARIKARAGGKGPGPSQRRD